MVSALDDRITSAFPVLRNVNWTQPRQDDESLFNVIGARTRKRYLSPHWFDEMNFITVNEEMFEWVTIVETICGAADRYVIADLGAGYGRWIVNAALLARRFGRIPFVIGVEAEDTHFRWMKEHLADNEISLSEQRLFHAPITGKREDVPFTVGHAQDWYGQAVLPSSDTGFGEWPHAQVEMRRSIILQDIIADALTIDLLYLDIQGMEVEVVKSARDLLAENVKRLHVGTHSRQLEDTLRGVMNEAGWRSRFDYPCATPNYPTLAGPVDFGDGVQDWINPRFG